MATSKILTSIVLLVAIFLSSCSGYEERKYIFQEPAKYEYRCIGFLRQDCKKVNTNVTFEMVLKDEYKDLPKEELDKVKSRKDFLKDSAIAGTTFSMLGILLGSSIMNGYSYAQSSGFIAGVLAGGATLAVELFVLGMGVLLVYPIIDCALDNRKGDERYTDVLCSRTANYYEIEDIKKVEEMDRIRARVQGKKE